MKTLSESIAALYEAFSDVPKPREIAFCKCCITQGEIDVLLTKDLRALTGKELFEYSTSALLTVGEVEDFLYFLPRIIELACVKNHQWSEIAWTGEKIRETDLNNWPSQRREALGNVFQAVIEKYMGEEDGWELDDWICAIARSGEDVLPFLEQIENSTKGLLLFYERNSEALSKGRLGSAFWSRKDPGYDEVFSWIRSDNISQKIQKAYGLA